MISEIKSVTKQLLHTAPSYMMVTDALMQFLKKKNWTKLFFNIWNK